MGGLYERKFDHINTLFPASKVTKSLEICSQQTNELSRNNNTNHERSFYIFQNDTMRILIATLQDDQTNQDLSISNLLTILSTKQTTNDAVTTSSQNITLL